MFYSLNILYSQTNDYNNISKNLPNLPFIGPPELAPNNHNVKNIDKKLKYDNTQKDYSDPALLSKLKKAIDIRLAAVAPSLRNGVTACVTAPNLGVWKATSGYSVKETLDTLTTDMLFNIGSITKTFTAALIFKLEEEGRLSIDDKIIKYFPIYDNIDTNITIRQLLNHTSGLFDYLNNNPNFLYNCYTNPDKVWTSDEIFSTLGTA
jgi:CubicO group peptidase (beta-lactamase class C family)